MSHLKSKPSPPSSVAPGDRGHAVDSSANVATPGNSSCDGVVELAQEVDRLEVLAAAELVGDPLAAPCGSSRGRASRRRRRPAGRRRGSGRARDRARHQERAHLGPPVVEDRRRPVGVVALAWVGVLVEVGAVEAGEPVGVHREVRRHPVEDDADASLVQPVDHRHQIGGRAVAGGRREVPGRLVAPRAVERVLHDRQQLDVGEAVGQTWSASGSASSS